MKTVLAVALAFFCLCAASTFAAVTTPPKATQTFECKELSDNARDHLIKLKVGIARAEVENFWGDGRRDPGEIKTNKANGDRIFKGFPHWVADGVEGSGYLFLSRKLLEKGKGKAGLYNRFCQGSCATRTAKLECRVQAPETVGPQKP